MQKLHLPVLVHIIVVLLRVLDLVVRHGDGVGGQRMRVRAL